MIEILPKCCPGVAKQLGGLLTALVLFAPVGANATVVFNLVYDNLGGNQQIDTIVGTGTLSYGGSLTFGQFALNSLTGLNFNATVDGHTFTIADLTGSTSTSGIDVFDLGGGLAGMVFTGNGGGVAGGSFDLANSSGTVLTHEPTSDITNPIGCCGGNGVINEYVVAGTGIKDYQATTTVPEPATIALLGIGIAGIGWSRKKVA